MENSPAYTLDHIQEKTGFDKRTIAYYVQEGLVPKVGRRGPKTRYPQLFLDRLLFVRMIRQKQDAGEVGQLTLKEIRGILDRTPADTVADVAAGRKPFRPGDFQTEAKPDDSNEPKPVVEPSEPVLSMALARERIAAMDRRFAPMRAEVQDDSSAAFSVFDKAAESMPAVAAQSNTAADLQFSFGAAPEPKTKDTIPRAVRYEDTIKQKVQEEVEPEPAPQPESNGFPDVSKHDRLGWSLARLQRALSNVPRRRSGNTESWHRARITPELTISARNLSDVDAHLLDSVSRMLKQLLWEAWEE